MHKEANELKSTYVLSVSEPLTETSSMSKTGSAPEAMGVRSLQM
jgi:hypothetical protein